MKLEGSEGEILLFLSEHSEKGIVYVLHRQLNRICFSLPESEIMQECIAQINWYRGLLITEEPRKKESKLLRKVVWRNV